MQPKKKMDKLDFIKIKTCMTKDIIKKGKGNPQDRRKYLQNKYLMIALVKNSYN